MNHYYAFLDRAIVDRLWSLKWQTLMSRHTTKWVTSLELDQGEYAGDSLRGLLSFSLDPQPSARKLEEILERATVKDTLRRCHPQFWTMFELASGVLPTLRNAVVGDEVGDEKGIVKIAIQAYRDRKITAPTLWATLKLHSVQLADLKTLDARESTSLRLKLPWERLWEPVYTWQDSSAFRNDEWTNCLKTPDTRRFMNFLVQAERENWPATSTPDGPRFSDFEDGIVLARLVRKKASRLQRPFVYRVWE